MTTALYCPEPFITTSLLSRYDFSNVERDLKRQIIILLHSVLVLNSGVLKNYVFRMPRWIKFDKTDTGPFCLVQECLHIPTTRVTRVNIADSRMLKLMLEILILSFIHCLSQPDHCQGLGIKVLH